MKFGATIWISYNFQIQKTIWGNTVYSLTELGNMLKPQFRKRGKIYTTHIKILLILWMSIFLLIKKKLNQIPYFGQYLYFSPCSLKLPPPNLVTHTNFAHRAMYLRVLELNIFLKAYLLKYMGIILSSIFIDINHFCNCVSFKNDKIWIFKFRVNFSIPT